MDSDSDFDGLEKWAECLVLGWPVLVRDGQLGGWEGARCSHARARPRTVAYLTHRQERARGDRH